MIGDVHAGSNGASTEQLRQVVESANAEKPDAIMLLGDYVSRSQEKDSDGHRMLKMPAEEMANCLAGLKAEDGIFAILGNHDLGYSEADVAAELKRVGIKVLEDEMATVERSAKQLSFIGLRDHSTRSWTALHQAAVRIAA
jgi:predicted MPP superfamily phosphohydrolase